MPGRPHRLMRHTAQLVLALVLLAPVVAAAHVHGFGAETASAACSVCTVAKHAPAVMAAGTLVAGTAPQVVASALTHFEATERELSSKTKKSHF